MNKDKINEQFSYLIREKMTDEQFWSWVASWKDAHDICEEAENWDIEDKKETLKTHNF